MVLKGRFVLADDTTELPDFDARSSVGKLYTKTQHHGPELDGGNHTLID